MADEGFFVGYPLNSKPFRLFNNRTMIVEEALHIRFSENTPNNVGSGPNWLFDIDALTKTMNYQPIVAGIQSNGNVGTKDNNNACQARKEKEPGKYYILLPLWTADLSFLQEPKSSQDAVFKPSNDVGKKVNEFSRQENECKDQEEKNNVNSTNRVNVVHSTVNDVSNEVNVICKKSSIELPDDPNMPELEDISIFEDSNEDVLGHIQEEGIDYDEVFAPVARIEAIRLFLAYASFKDFMVYQMDVKSDFLYIKIEEEVYVCQPPGFEDLDFYEKVYKVEKALYGLHQAPRAWYETLSTYLLDNGFHRGKIDKTLFIKRHKDDILLVQIYVDDIIFGSTKKELCNAFEKLMHDKFQMSSMGEPIFFLGLQVKQKKEDIFISQDTYVAAILKKFGFFKVKTTSTPMETQKPLLKDEDRKEVDAHIYRSMIGSLMYLTSSRPDIMFVVCACARYQVNLKVLHLHAVKRIFKYLKGQPKLGLWYSKDSPFDLMAYTDSDYAGASLDRKSTTEGCQFLRCRLISCQCKKKIVVVNPTTEADYVAASSCCGQFWTTAKSKTVNEEVQIHALVDGMRVIINESSVRRDLQLADEDDKQLDGLPTHKEKYDVSFHTKKVFANMKRIGGDSLVRATTTASSLEAEQDSGNIDKTQTKATSNEPSSQGTSLGDGPRCQDTMRDTYAHTRYERVSKMPIDSLLERIDEIDVDEDIALVSTHDDVSTQDNIVQDEGIEDVGEEEVLEVVTTAKMIIDVVVDAAQVTTAIVDIPVSAAETIVTTTSTITAESIKTNVKVTQAPKRKGVMIQEPKETTTIKTASSQQPQVQDKVEKVQTGMQAEIDEEDRLEREKAQKEQEANDALINT
nr:putative ribonuclease H-like domain-containing protein [Tanacetum cinerariifolium]